MICPADVEWETDTDTVGIFGCYRSLSLIYPQPIPEGARIYMQNLLEDEAKDVTDRAEIGGRSVLLDGKLLADVGVIAARGGEPTYDQALVLKIVREP